MPIAIDKSGPVPVFQPEGQINSANAAAFEADLLTHLEKGEQKIVLDLSRLNYISSAGLRVLLLLAKKMKQSGGALVLFGAQPNVKEIFEISGFLVILKVCDTREQAFAALP
ncbi:STAS domain-containing protein [Alcaligenes sp. WGS1538]|uniref:STAS domain-containing protein n=1 Tax=Alcaligenes sp. WGS1538 TaxID=3366811 RepID=UPI00372CF296